MHISVTPGQVAIAFLVVFAMGFLVGGGISHVHTLMSIKRGEIRGYYKDEG